MKSDLSRRAFLKDTALLAGAAAAMQSLEPAAAQTSQPWSMPKIRLGQVEVSRLILGSNPFFGYAHRDGDIGRQMAEYFTPERIMAVLDQAAELGVTTVVAPPSPAWIGIFAKYLDRGGKLNTWIAQPHGSPKGMKKEIDTAVKAGAKAFFIQGHRVEEQFDQKAFDVVRGWLEHGKSHGMAVGLASHRPGTHLIAEKLGFPTDFYFQCFFRVDQHPENFALECREKAVATIRAITTKPVVAYKILGAARIPPEEGFAYAFKNIAAKDGVCVGIYNKDRPGMLAEDVGLMQRRGGVMRRVRGARKRPVNGALREAVRRKGNRKAQFAFPCATHHFQSASLHTPYELRYSKRMQP